MVEILEPSWKNSNERNEGLSDEQLGNLIAAIGNHEAKAITLGLMEPGRVYDWSGITKTVNGSQGDTPGWTTNGRGFLNYCSETFAPIGLVVKEVLNNDLSTYGYEKTVKGETQGDAFAGLVLDFSLRYPEFSLQDFFGSTSSAGVKRESAGGVKKNRAPITRYKILWDLVTSTLPVRSADLERNLKEEGILHTSEHLEELARRGVIDYKHAGHEKPITSYKYKEDAPVSNPPHHNQRKLMNYVNEMLKSNPSQEFKLFEIAEAYIKDEGEDLSAEQTANLRRRFSAELAHLERDGYIERGKFWEEKRSEVNMTSRQIDAAFSLITMLDKFKQQDFEFLQFGRKRLREILNEPITVSNLMRKAKEHSPHATRTPRGESIGAILEIIAESTDSTLDSIQKELFRRGINLSKPGVNNLLNHLKVSGYISFEVTKDVRHFFLNKIS